MLNTNYNTSDDMIEKLQQIKGKTKLKLYKNVSNYYIEMKNFQTHHEDPFSRNAQGISKVYHEVLLLTKFLQTKSEVKNRNMIYYNLYNTVIKTRGENKNTDNLYENDEKDYIDINDFINPNLYVGIIKNNEILR